MVKNFPLASSARQIQFPRTRYRAFAHFRLLMAIRQAHEDWSEHAGGEYKICLPLSPNANFHGPKGFSAPAIYRRQCVMAHAREVNPLGESVKAKPFGLFDEHSTVRAPCVNLRWSCDSRRRSQVCPPHALVPDHRTKAISLQINAFGTPPATGGVSTLRPVGSSRLSSASAPHLIQVIPRDHANEPLDPVQDR